MWKAICQSPIVNSNSARNALGQAIWGFWTTAVDLPLTSGKPCEEAWTWKLSALPLVPGDQSSS